MIKYSEENASHCHSVHYKMIQKEDVPKSGSISFLLLKLHSFSRILEITKNYSFLNICIFLPVVEHFQRCAVDAKLQQFHL